MKGKGYVEFLACKDEILSMINDGYHYTQIHQILFDQGKITTKYKNFYRILHKIGISKPRFKPLKHGSEVMNEFLLSMNKDNEKIYKEIEMQKYRNNEVNSSESSVVLNNDPDEQDRHW
jgi:hypothetical protein